MPTVSLDRFTIVDGHAHPPLLTRPATEQEWWEHWYEGRAQDAISAAQLPANRWALAQLSDWLGCEATVSAILSTTERLGQGTLLDALGGVGVDGVVFDTGHPHPSTTWSPASVGHFRPMAVGSLLRIEVAAEALLSEERSFESFVEQFERTIAAARSDGFVGLKSIIAYRSGLAVELPTPAEARLAYGRQVKSASGRLTEKPLLDFLFVRALRLARVHELSIQVHTGTGDRDLDLLLSNPACLRKVLESGEADDVPLVLLHGSSPYTAEAALLASIYPNLYIDVSTCIPPHGRFSLLNMWRTVLSIAPLNRVQVSSDSTGLPEQIAVGAMRARQTLGQVLGEMVDSGEMTPAGADETAEAVLAGTARRLYGWL